LDTFGRIWKQFGRIWNAFGMHFDAFGHIGANLDAIGWEAFGMNLGHIWKTDPKRYRYSWTSEGPIRIILNSLKQGLHPTTELLVGMPGGFSGDTVYIHHHRAWA